MRASARKLLGQNKPFFFSFSEIGLELLHVRANSDIDKGHELVEKQADGQLVVSSLSCASN